VIESKSESRCFRRTNSSFQESDLVCEAVLVSTEYTNNAWALIIFAEWYRLREVQVQVLDCGGLSRNTICIFIEYEDHAPDQNWLITLEYSKHPHIRTHDFGTQADQVLIYRVFSEKSASRCS